MSDLTFWQNVVSIHQAPFIRALSAIWPGDVHVVTDVGLPEARRQSGWDFPDYGGAKLHVGPHEFRPGEVEERFGGAGSLHVFSSVRRYPGVYDALRRISRQRDTTIAVFAEAGSDADGFRALLRPWSHRLDALRWRARIDFFLAVGSKGVDYYDRCGFRRDRLFEFGYAVEPQQTDGIRLANRKLLFVGNLAWHKGADLLLRALAMNPSASWHLDVVGDGPLSDDLMTNSRDLGVDDRVKWHGSLANHRVREMMASADILVLPSRYDGWGAVVNEALMAGTTAIVSEGCGAADLVRSGDRGAVFRKGSVGDLTKAIATTADKIERQQIRREATRDWALKAISPDSFARYFISITEAVRDGAPRPAAPWRFTS